MTGMTKLKRLDISRNKITALPPGFLEQTEVEKIANEGNPCELQSQPGFAAVILLLTLFRFPKKQRTQYNERRVKCVDKQLETGGKVTLGL